MTDEPLVKFLSDNDFKISVTDLRSAQHYTVFVFLPLPETLDWYYDLRAWQTRHGLTDLPMLNCYCRRKGIRRGWIAAFRDTETALAVEFKLTFGGG